MGLRVVKVDQTGWETCTQKGEGLRDKITKNKRVRKERKKGGVSRERRDGITEKGYEWLNYEQSLAYSHYDGREEAVKGVSEGREV